MLCCWPSTRVAAQPEEDTKNTTLSIHAAGVHRYERGTTGVFALNGGNRTDQDAEVRGIVYLNGDSRMQYERRFWVPPHATRRTWLPFLTPSTIAPDRESLSASTMHVEVIGGQEQLQRKYGDVLVSDSIYPLDQSGLRMGLIFGNTVPTVLPDPIFDPDEEAYAAVIEVRQMMDEDRRTINLHDQFLPPFAEAYEGLDQIVMCEDRVREDSGCLTPLRSWLSRGGHMWIMADRVPLETVRALLGSTACYQIIDRVELTEFEIESNSELKGELVTEHWESERPVEFVRVALESGRVLCRIDGWPAAFVVPVDNGEVIFTTLAARGWRYEHGEFADPPPPGMPTSGGTKALRAVASLLHMSRAEQWMNTEQIKPILQEQIGYEIPARRKAGLILGLNCAVLLGAGIFFGRRHKLEHLAWVVPSVTLVSALSLAALGSAHSGQVPASMAALQLVDISPATNEAHVSTLSGFYSPTNIELPLAGEGAQFIRPDTHDLSGSVKRIVWDDYGRTRWLSVPVASSTIRFVNSEDHLQWPEPPRARGRFGPRGWEGVFIAEQSAGAPTDAVIVWPPAPHAAVSWGENGQVVSGSHDVLSTNEYLQGTLLTDDQQRRQVFYRSLLETGDDQQYPHQPTLFYWSQPLDLAGVRAPTFTSAVSTLYATPLEFERTPSQSQFLVPASFIRVENVPGKLGMSSVYSPRTGQWMVDPTLPSDSMFRGVLPGVVQPCEVTRVTLQLKIHAPSRVVAFTTLRDGEELIVEKYENPSGVITCVVDKPALLGVDSAGGVLFGVSVGPTALQAAGPDGSADTTDKSRRGAPSRRPFEHSTWQIDYFRMHVEGKTL